VKTLCKEQIEQKLLDHKSFKTGQAVSLILEGLGLGLALTLLLGPIFIALTQSSIEGGARAGFSVGFGVWVSDFTIITLCYLFVQKISFIVEDNSFVYWMGLLGGFVLITFGIGTFLSKSDFNSDIPAAKISKRGFFGYFSKGFLVNTINPFTFGFWISVISPYVLGRGITNDDAILLFGSIMFVIITTDIAKILLARFIRNKLNANHIDIFSKVAGAVLFIFGIVLLIRVGL